ncbi:MAG: hypothetical protein IPH13_19445 [Planctomycetes bacterium]|nr:hypothetical protein [Planctomycetota bacterium]MCC7172208.1 hypothetical protein [Planctomycetota bacterium]
MFGPSSSWSSLAAIAIGVAAFASGDEQAVAVPDVPWPVEAASMPFQELGNCGYLAAWLGLSERAATTPDLGAAAPLVPDFLGTIAPWVGEHAAALEQRAKLMDVLGTPARGAGARPDFAGWRAEPALDAVLRLARDRRVVMFDEEHLSSRERAFMHLVLEGLREAGFTHLACETLAEDRALNERGHPVMTSGYYSKDPLYGDLLRRADALGFSFAMYEASPEEARPRPDDASPNDATNRREVAQAKKLATMLDDPSARVVVFAGRHHISEAKAAAPGDWTPMAGVFAELTGVDPLTIDLIVLTERGRAIDDHPAWLEAHDEGFLTDHPVMLFDAAGAPYTALPGMIDAMVFFPRTRIVDGRPDWLELGGLRKRVWPVPESVVADDVVLMQAIVAGEGDDAVPMDQVVLGPGKARVALMLRSGEYLVRVVDRKGVVMWEQSASVE